MGGNEGRVLWGGKEGELFWKVGCSNSCDASKSKQLMKSRVFHIGSSVGVRGRKRWSMNIQMPEGDFDFLFFSVLLEKGDLTGLEARDC